MPRKDVKASQLAKPTSTTRTDSDPSTAITQLDPNLVIRTFRPSDCPSLHRLHSSSYKGQSWRAVKSLLFHPNVAKIYVIAFGIVINILMFLFNRVQMFKAYSVEMTIISVSLWTVTIPVMLWWFFRIGFRENIKTALEGELKDVATSFRLEPESDVKKEGGGKGEDDQDKEDAVKTISTSTFYVAITPSNFWVCVDTASNDVVGSVGLEYKEIPSTDSKHRIGELRRLVVNPKYVSQGVMDALIAESVRWARGHKLSKLFAINLTTVQMEQRQSLEKAGFVILKRKLILQGYEYLAYEMEL